MADPFISEFQIRNPGSGVNTDFVEIAVDQGTDVSDLQITVYQTDGSVRATYDVSDGTLTTVGDKDVYVLTVDDNGFRAASGQGLALSDNTTVYQFVTDAPNVITATAGPANGLSSTDVTPGTRQPSGQSTERQVDGTYVTEADPTPGWIPCFTKDTLIETSAGPKRIETLKRGDLIKTMDHGLQAIRWIGSRTLSKSALVTNEKLCPIVVKASALGRGYPATDLTVSPQHRILLRSKIALRMFGVSEILVPAVKLTALEGVDATDPDEVTYFHLLFDHHEIVFANGHPAESLFIGPLAMDGLSEPSRAEIECIFPEVLNPSFRPVPVRTFVNTRTELQSFFDRLRRNRKPAYAIEPAQSRSRL